MPSANESVLELGRYLLPAAEAWSGIENGSGLESVVATCVHAPLLVTSGDQMS
jgi:hypothetical protein